jgi:hypothetical protein
MPPATSLLVTLAALAPASSFVAPSRGRCAAVSVRSEEGGASFQNTVKTVSDTIKLFDAGYTKPILSLWTSPINDMLQTTHISKVDERFVYDELFGFGFVTLMDMIMSPYPVAGDGEKITDALIAALDMDPATLRGDHKAVTEWLAGKTEADVLAAVASNDGSKVASAAATIKGQKEFHHTRPSNVGLVAVMDAVGCKPDDESLARWTEAFGMRAPAVQRNAGLLKEYQEKVANAMQMIKSAEIMEKKRMAEALEAKAKAAQEKAESASSKKDEIKTAEKAEA